MTFLRSLIPGLCSILILSSTACSAVHARSEGAWGIPIRAAIVIDAEFASRAVDSDALGALRAVLEVNKIPFDALDVSQLGNGTFLDTRGNLRYSVLVLVAPGWRVGPETSRLILEAAREGMGVVGLMPDCANADLMPLFGIEQLGESWLTGRSLEIAEDRFTLSYEGQTVSDVFPHLDHHLLADADVVGSFVDPPGPAIWTYSFGAGKTAFHNHGSGWSYNYRGLLLQSVLYAMPVGVACPINAGAIEVDDWPRAFSSSSEVGQWRDVFYSNFKRWLETYNLTATFFIAFSYSGDIGQFWAHPEPLECVNDILRSGYELGLHCGSEHLPLTLACWGSEDEIQAEAGKMVRALDLLRHRLGDKFGTELGEVLSYAAPSNQLDDCGYEALDSITDIRYVGTAWFAANSSTVRDFGWEGDHGLYNLPRIKGDFYGFADPLDEEHEECWSILRSTIESGGAYLIFTHPDEAELLDEKRAPDASMREVFEGYRVWADYVSARYPFYRWWTCSELGRYLERREGLLDAQWFPGESKLVLRPSQPDDAIHIKTEEYLRGIARLDGAIVLTFGTGRRSLGAEDYEVICLGRDYFIYPREAESSWPIVPERPFVFDPVAEPPGSRGWLWNGLPLATVLGVVAATGILIVGTALVGRMARG